DCDTPSGYATTSDDCDDGDPTSHPGAAEIAYDLADNDCDGHADNMVVATESGWTVLGATASDGLGWGGTGSTYGTGMVTTTEDLDGDGDPELVVCGPGLDVDDGSTTTTD